MENNFYRTKDKRYYILDGIRGIAILNMIIYHMVWDLVHLFGMKWTWYHSPGAFIWQQGICWTFIFLSGFCHALGQKRVKRGWIVFLVGALLSVFTSIVMPENRVVFGVLTLIGSCMLLMIPLEPILKKGNPVIGFAISMSLFILTKNINQGYLGFGDWNVLSLPDYWYCNLVTTYFGMPMPGFYSTDYFSLFPWVFLYVAGIYCYQFCNRRRLLWHLKASKVEVIEWLGQHSLLIYIAHQPILFVVLHTVFTILL